MIERVRGIGRPNEGEDCLDGVVWEKGEEKCGMVTVSIPQCLIDTYAGRKLAERMIRNYFEIWPCIPK